MEWRGKRLLLRSKCFSIRYDERSDYPDGFVFTGELTNTNTNTNADTDTDTDTDTNTDTNTDTDTNANANTNTNTNTNTYSNANANANGNTDADTYSVSDTHIARSARQYLHAHERRYGGQCDDWGIYCYWNATEEGHYSRYRAFAHCAR